MGTNGEKQTMSIYNLVPDIYKAVATKQPAEGVDLHDEIDRFGENCKRLMYKSVHGEA